jgi:peptidoglycan/xylan/chitin deacetylase (PgdA/CDA1 family)
MMVYSPSYRRFGRRVLAALLPRRLFLVSGPASLNSVFLTFDDGPHPEHTPQLLDMLRDLRVVATFFVIGREAAHWPEIVRRIASEGHAIGNHSFSHSQRSHLSAAQMLDEVRRTRDLLHKFVGTAPRLFRPPRGQMTALDLWNLWREGQTIALWNADPMDYSETSSEAIVAWFRNHPIRSGDVILLHDKEPHALRVLPELIKSIRRRGLNFATLTPWL